MSQYLSISGDLNPTDKMTVLVNIDIETALEEDNNKKIYVI
jgi:hypothetical protein